jgi:predicted DNA-binding transcriptional regulator AlpA
MRASALRHLVAIPTPGGEAPNHLDTITQIADFLNESRSHVEHLVEEGLPCFDTSIPRPGRRRKRALRFDRAECLAWLRDRRQRGAR